MQHERLAAIHPELWRGWVSRSGIDVGEPRALKAGFVQSWQNTSRVMRQPPLDHHLVVLHEGGGKRVQRDGGGGRRTADVAERSITTAEAGSAYRWRTEGPIAFSHFYIKPSYFSALVADTFDRDPASVSFAETIGRPDPYGASLFEMLMAGRNDPDWHLSADFYADALLVRLAQTSHWGGEFRQYRRLTLAPHIIARVHDFVLDNLDTRITLDDLAAIGGYSRYHFVRAFKESTGVPPYHYVLQARIALARDLLQHGRMPIADIARRCGFTTHAHFSIRFRQAIGVTPAEFRRRTGGRPG